MKRTTSLVLLLIIATSTFAWGPKGHRIVAQVAYDNLNTKVRRCRIRYTMYGLPLYMARRNQE